MLEVGDEGVGISADELDAIFQPFRGSFAKGTGLGLAIVHRIVSDYGGEIQVSSTPGRGTTVCVRLPVRAVAAAAYIGTHADQTCRRKRRRTRRRDCSSSTTSDRCASCCLSCCAARATT